MVFKSLDCVVKTKRVEAFVDVQLDVAPIIGFFIERLEDWTKHKMIVNSIPHNHDF